MDKYRPTEWDPQVIKQTSKTRNSVHPTVRLRASFYGEYIYKGRRFKARKEMRTKSTFGFKSSGSTSAVPVAPVEGHLQTDPKNIDYACEKGAKRNVEPWRDQSKMEEVNETTEERSHRLEVEEVQEEMELREWNAIGAAGREGDG